MYGERLAFGGPEARMDLADVTGSYIATLATFGTVQFPPVRTFRTTALTEAPAPVAPPVAETWPPVSMAAFQAPQQNAYAHGALARHELALAA